MMDLKDKDVNSGLGTGSTNFRIRTKLLSTSGAGVNADSNVNSALATCDPLSELVWSPGNGLSLKCANPRADDRKPFLLWNVESSNAEGLSPLQSIIQKPIVDQGNLTVSQSALVSDDIFIVKASKNGHTPKLGPSQGDRSESDREMEDGADKKREEICMVDRWADLCRPQTVQTDIIAESREEIAAVVSAAPSKKLESSAENDLRPTENALPAEGSCMSSRISLYQDKGKGKVLSDGDIYRRSSDDEDNIHESSESSNSGLSIKGIKRQIYDTDVIIGSKRMKKQIHGSDGLKLTSFMKPDHSFMKWISNMTKGLSESNNEETLNLLPLACSNDVYIKNYSASISMGFQTTFQSLHYRETDASNTEVKKIVESVDEESREHVVDDKKLPCGNSSEHSILCNKEVDNLVKNVASEDPVSSRAKDGDKTKITTKEAYPDMPVATGDVLERSNPRTSLWITRLSTKTLRSEKGKEKAEEAIGCSTSFPKADLDSQANAETRDKSTDLKTNASMKEKSISKLHSQRFSSEALVSVFAMRLDALRHITSSKKGTYATCSYTCLYCGGCHDVCKCPSVTKSELRDLLLKLSTFDSRRAEESSCLCIRCSKFDHWAVSCPVAPSSRKRISDGKASFGARGLKLYTGSGRDQSTVRKSAIFDAIRNLRLTRADILRWMNSDVPSSHLNGFFLRLRLGSLEAGLGEGSYCVACITGDVRENNGSTSKKSILVDVGGIKSSVTSQYVSNHDFQEDEIKAWWRRTVGSGCRIPTLTELNSKFNDRKL